jgi:pilus assembly protein Flp/PilA
MTRLTETYIRLRELARRPFGEGLGRRDDGQGMVEYALILVLIAIVVILILTTVGKQAKNVFSNISSGLGT